MLREIVGYANDVHRRDNVSERGMSIYGERQPDSMLPAIEDDVNESQEDKDIDIGTQGSRDAHVEYGVGGENGSPTAWSEFQSGEGTMGMETTVHEVGSSHGTTALEIEDIHTAGTQRAAVDAAVASTLRESGVLTEDDICAAASQEDARAHRMDRISEETEGADIGGRVEGSDFSDTVLEPPSSPIMGPPEIPPGFERPPRGEGRTRRDQRMADGGEGRNVSEGTDPSTPVGRLTTKKARTSPDHDTPTRGLSGGFGSRIYTEADHQREMFGRITDDEASMASATFSTPKTEGKRRASVTPKRERKPEEYSIETPERRRAGRAESSPPSIVHPSMASTVGDGRDPVRDSRIAGLEVSVSELYEKCKDGKEKADQINIQVNSMHQELLDLTIKVGNADQQAKKGAEMATTAKKTADQVTGRVDRLAGQIARMNEVANESNALMTATKAMAEQALSDAARREDATRSHAGRVATLESIVGELGTSTRTVRDQIGEIERQGNERENDRRESAQKIERSVHEMDKRTDRRVSQLAEDSAAQIKEIRRELDERLRATESRPESKTQSASCDGPCACTKSGAFAGKCLDSGARELIRREAERVNQSLNQLQRRLEGLGNDQRARSGDDKDSLKREIEKIQGRMKSMATIFDQQHQKDVDNMGRFKEAIRIVSTKVDKILVSNTKDINDVKRSLDQRKEEITALGEKFDRESRGHQTFYGMKRDEAPDEEHRSSAQRSASIDVSQRGIEGGGFERKLGQVQGELRAAKEYMKDEEGKRRIELEAMKRESAKIAEEVKSLGTRVAETERSVKDIRETAIRKMENLEKGRESALEREKVAQREAKDAVRRLDLLENELENRDRKIERLMDEVREGVRNAASSERADGLMAKIIALEEKMMSTIGENAAPAGHTTGEPRSFGPDAFARRGDHASIFTPAPSVAEDGSVRGETFGRNRRGHESQTRSSSAGLYPEDIRQGDRKVCEICQCMGRSETMRHCPNCSAVVCGECYNPMNEECPRCEIGRNEQQRTAYGMPIPRVVKNSREQGPVGGGNDGSDSTSGMNKCDDIKIAKSALTSHNLNAWINGVAQAARVAFLYDSEYAHACITGVMKMRESDRLKKLHYSALESKLYQALRETIKPGTPEASLLSTLEMKASMERRMPTSMQLLYALVDRIRVPEEDESAVYTGALLNATVQTVPRKSEEQSIEEFLTRWDNALNNLRYSETMINPKVLARTFLSKIKGAACMTYTAEKWEEIPQEQRTYTIGSEGKST